MGCVILPRGSDSHKLVAVLLPLVARVEKANAFFIHGDHRLPLARRDADQERNHAEGRDRRGGRDKRDPPDAGRARLRGFAARSSGVSAANGRESRVALAGGGVNVIY